jgi:hypothetical protein
VIHNRFDLPVIFPLALGSIHTKRIVGLQIVYIIYMWRTLHYPELSLQSKGGPPLHCILYLYYTLLGGFGIKPFVYQNIRLFQLVKFDAKGSAAKPQELLSPFSSLKIHLSTSTLRHLQSNQISPTTQGVRVSVRLLVSLHDETPGLNLTHPASYSLGFARGVSSSLTPNAFKFDYNMSFR